MSKTADTIISPVKKGRGGIFMSHHKNTAEKPVERMPLPKTVVLPMLQHIGAPCTPLVKVGDTVDAGQIIGDTDKFVSAPVHATVSGTVKAVGDVYLANGMVCTGVTIESDGEMRMSPDIQPPVVESREELVKAVRQSGLVGLGGAGFPSHVKLSFDDSKNVDTLIVNAAECEPFITVDYRECTEHPADILDGINILQKYFNFKQIIIAAEDNKPKALKILKEIAAADDKGKDVIKLMSLKSKYPQGAEKMMILSATGRQVPPGKLPADVGCVVMNVGSVAFIGRYVKTGKPLISRSITVDGTAVSEPKNIRVPIGTNIQDIIDFCGGYSKEPKKVIFGGPMMGIALSSTQAPICKQNNAILAFADAGNILKKERDCIRCGRCVEHCPMSLMPTLIERYAKAKDTDRLKKIGVNVCMECGSCAYSCPSGRPLVQYMRLAKQVLREEMQKNG